MAFPGVGIAKGMVTTFRNFFAPKVTRQYPEERPQIPDRWRGRLDLIYDPFGEHKCEVCFQCAQVCPVEAIDMSGFDSQGNRIRYGMPEIYDERKDAERLSPRRTAGEADAQPGALGRGGRHALGRRDGRRLRRPPGGAGGDLPRHRGPIRLPARARAAPGQRPDEHPLGAGLRRRRPRRIPAAPRRRPRRHRLRLRRVPLRRRRRRCSPRSSDELGIRAGRGDARRVLHARDRDRRRRRARSARPSASTPWSTGRSTRPRRGTSSASGAPRPRAVAAPS